MAAYVDCLAFVEISELQINTFLKIAGPRDSLRFFLVLKSPICYMRLYNIILVTIELLSREIFWAGHHLK